MRILFYDTKPYDRHSFDAIMERYEDVELEYLEEDLNEGTARYAAGFDAVCIFVSSDARGSVLERLVGAGVKLVLLRCAGFNNVDVERAGELGLVVMRVPAYSPEAVAEHAMALAMAVNRKIHKAYIKVRENNFSLQGLTGMNFHGKTAGIVGTGRIGAAMCRICNGFGMRVRAYDMYPDRNLDGVEYVGLDELLSGSDLISLHCPLTDATRHLVNKDTIAMMKDGVILVNTSRGALVDTDDLIGGIRDRKFFGVGLDVYEEEAGYVFENRSEDILQHSITARLLSFPNVIVTSHQGFLTNEALEAIAATTLDNVDRYREGRLEGAYIVV
jgi:D-lactate dehydrogenase